MTYQTTPLGLKLEVPIPQDFVGKRVRIEVVLDEEPAENEMGSIRQFRGAISKELAAELQEHIRKSREEWG